MYKDEAKETRVEKERDPGTGPSRGTVLSRRG